MWDSVQRIIRTYDSFLITSHVNPDGDAIGSEMALKAFLEDLDKQVVVANASPTPDPLVFLDPAGEIQHCPSGVSRDLLEDIDAIFVLDLNNWDQLGGVASSVQHSPLPRVCIDHHVEPRDDFASVVVSDTSAAATGILVYELILSMGGKIRKAIADALYATIITDTGTFRFSNTDPRALRAAANLCELGANPFSLHRQVFGNKTWATGRLLGPVLATLQSAADGRLAWITASLEMLRVASATYDDMEGFADLVRAIKDVELVLFFKETADGHIKVSLRSNGRVDAYAIARHFGGGGHRMASGMRVDGPLDAAVRLVVDACLQVDGIRSE
jgi:phosphoesterase RecJ-like protein